MKGWGILIHYYLGKWVQKTNPVKNPEANPWEEDWTFFEEDEFDKEFNFNYTKLEYIC